MLRSIEAVPTFLDLLLLFVVVVLGWLVGMYSGCCVKAHVVGVVVVEWRLSPVEQALGVLVVQVCTVVEGTWRG